MDRVVIGKKAIPGPGGLESIVPVGKEKHVLPELSGQVEDGDSVEILAGEAAASQGGADLGQMILIGVAEHLGQGADLFCGVQIDMDDGASQMDTDQIFPGADEADQGALGGQAQFPAGKQAPGRFAAGKAGICCGQIASGKGEDTGEGVPVRDLGVYPYPAKAAYKRSGLSGTGGAVGSHQKFPVSL